jgi:hypothetical protein
MGFLDKAKAAANELAAKADTALASSGMTGGPPGTQPPDKLLRDLGVLAWLELNGRPQPDGERDRIVGALREAEQRGALGALTLQTAPPPPATAPPPPGAAAAQAPPPPPPPPGTADQASAPQQPPFPASDTGPGRPAQPSAPPPPPPSWAKPDES